jgi:hypothetical protein
MAIDAAQASIVSHEGSLTTLTISIVCPSNNRRWLVCTAIVGDSNAYVYSRKHGRVFELTQGKRYSSLMMLDVCCFLSSAA